MCSADAFAGWLVGTLPRTETHPLGDKWGPDAWLREQGLTTQYIHSFNWGAGMILAYVPREVYPQVLCRSL